MNESSVTISVPFLTREKFAELMGLPLPVFVAQCERGYWPTVKVGKRVLVNVELVRKQALEKEFSL